MGLYQMPVSVLHEKLKAERLLTEGVEGTALIT